MHLEQGRAAAAWEDVRRSGPEALSADPELPPGPGQRRPQLAPWLRSSSALVSVLCPRVVIWSELSTRSTSTIEKTLGVLLLPLILT